MSTATWREKNPGRHRTRYLLNKYGITEDDYDTMLEAQGGVCSICGGRHVYRGLDRLVIDHDHSTGDIRSLLCEPCNLILGLAEDNPDRLEKAAKYLRGGEA